MLLTCSPSSPVTEVRDAQTVRFTCSVSTFGPCRHTVRWEYKGRNNVGLVTRTPCSVTVSFMSYFDLIYCKVTDAFRKEQQFAYRPQSSGKKPGDNHFKSQDV